MIDIKIFRESPEIITESEKKRFKDPAIVNKIVEIDKKWRKELEEIQKLKHEKNKLSKEVGLLKKEGKTTESLFNRACELDQKIDGKEQEVENLKNLIDAERYKVGNLIHESVPVAPTEEGNQIIRTSGEPRNFDFEPKAHADLVEGFADLEKAAKLSGARTYYLKGDLVLLNQALINFALKKLISKGFLPMQTPFFMNEKYMKGAAELSDFKESLYRLEGEESYLIATSEQTLVSFHADEVIEEENLPIKYAGLSTCFRKEAGSHGKDTKGIFRVHQFDKVEQFIFCKPEDSWKFLEELTKNNEEIYKELELPFRVVNIASGELNDNAAKKYDLEAWFPAQRKYRELCSSSNCTDFQARKLNIKFGKQGGTKEYLHTLNSTAIATQRTISCILENYQNEDGSVTVPKVLREFIGKEVVNPIK